MRYFENTVLGFLDGTVLVAVDEERKLAYSVKSTGCLSELDYEGVSETVATWLGRGWGEVFFDEDGFEVKDNQVEVSSTDEKFDLISKYGASIVSFTYEGSDKPNKNVTVGISDLDFPSWAENIETKIRFTSRGRSYIIGKDNNDGYKIKIFRTDKIHNLKCRKV